MAAFGERALRGVGPDELGEEAEDPRDARRGAGRGALQGDAAWAALEAAPTA